MNNIPTTKTPLAIDPRFIIEAKANQMGAYVYSLYIGETYVLCLGIDGEKNERGVRERYIPKNADEDATRFAKHILDRIAAGKPYKNGERGWATDLLNKA